MRFFYLYPFYRHFEISLAVLKEHITSRDFKIRPVKVFYSSFSFKKVLEIENFTLVYFEKKKKKDLHVINSYMKFEKDWPTIDKILIKLKIFYLIFLIELFFAKETTGLKTVFSTGLLVIFNVWQVEFSVE